MGTSKNQAFWGGQGSRAGKTGVYGRIHEDLSTWLTPPSRKRTVFRGALSNFYGGFEIVLALKTPVSCCMSLFFNGKCLLLFSKIMVST